MTEHPSVAILVLNYNGADCLPQCLASLKILEYPNYQVLVIDNGSEDQSFSQAQKDFPEYFSLPQKTNTGFAAGMNSGMKWALEKKYDFVWLMNSDATVNPDTLSELLRAHQADPRRQALSPVIENPDGSIWFAGGRINYFRMRTEHQHALLAPTPYQTQFLTGCAPLFATGLIRTVGMFDERFFLYYEDADLSQRILAAGHSLYVVPQARVIHAEKSRMTPKKVYYLVHYGMLFFALHTPPFLRIYIVAYVTIRRLVNQIKLLLGRKGAKIVASAYADYFKKFQSSYQLYLRKLS